MWLKCFMKTTTAISGLLVLKEESVLGDLDPQRYATM